MAKKSEIRVYQCRYCDEIWKNDSGISFHAKKQHADKVSGPIVLREWLTLHIITATIDDVSELRVTVRRPE